MPRGIGCCGRRIKEMDVDIGFSVCHGYRSDPEYLRCLADQLAPMDYGRFELCTEGDGIDRWISYHALERLNAHKPLDSGNREAVRSILGAVKNHGRQIALWTHEVWAPVAILDVYPELRTPKGDINLQHPLLEEFILCKYEQLFRLMPEIDVLVLTMTEVPFPVAQRFDNTWAPEDCIHWLIKTVREACLRARKRLVVRPFSAIAADNQATQSALRRLPDDIGIMVKSDPFDWNPFLPINPEIDAYPPERLEVEFDLGSEYFGRGAFPAIYPDYLRTRLDHVRSRGINTVIGRLDRAGTHALDNTGRLNVAFFTAHAAHASPDASRILEQEAATRYRTNDPAALCDAMKRAFECIKKIFYVDGHLLFHVMFGNLELAQRCMLFEILSPEQPLAHCRNEWPIQHDRKSPSQAAVLHEKEKAVAMAEEILRDVRRLAPEETALAESAENLLFFANLYHALVATIHSYLDEVVLEKQAPRFRNNLARLDEAIRVLRDRRGETWQDRIVVCAGQLAEELQHAFRLEQRVRSALPGLAPEDHGNLVDWIPCGYPAEGHSLCKFTHGSLAHSDGQQFWRVVRLPLSYTLAAVPGSMRLRMQVSGSGRLRILEHDHLLLNTVWNSGDTWEWLEFALVAGCGPLSLHVEAINAKSPRLGMVYLLSMNPCRPSDSHQP